MASLSVTPASLSLVVFAANTTHLTFHWPAGQADGRTFSADIVAAGLDDGNLAVVLDGDNLGVTIPGDIATVLEGVIGTFELVETTSGRDEVLISGPIRGTDDPGTPATGTVNLTVGEAQITLVVAPFPLSALQLLDGAVIDGGTP